jgi:hypothetical protein
MRYSNVLFSEIMTEFSKCRDRAKRIEVLRKYGDNRWFLEFLNYAFNPRIQFDVGSVPDYKPAVEPAGLNYSSLTNEVQRLYIFIAGHPKRTSKLDPRRELRILQALFQSIHRDESALLVKLFKKDLEVPYLSARLVKEAFPQLPFEVNDPIVEEPVAVGEPTVDTPIVVTGPKKTIKVKKIKA